MARARVFQSRRQCIARTPLERDRIAHVFSRHPQTSRMEMLPGDPKEDGTGFIDCFCHRFVSLRSWRRHHSRPPAINESRAGQCTLSKQPAPGSVRRSAAGLRAPGATGRGRATRAPGHRVPARPGWSSGPPRPAGPCARGGPPRHAPRTGRPSGADPRRAAAQAVSHEQRNPRAAAQRGSHVPSMHDHEVAVSDRHDRFGVAGPDRIVAGLYRRCNTMRVALAWSQPPSGRDSAGVFFSGASENF